MSYKPVHIITNDDWFTARLAYINLEYEQGAEDYTEEEGLHYHYHIHWPVGPNHTLSPTRNGAVGAFRGLNFRLGYNCPGCHGRQFNYRWPYCGLYYKFIWLQSPEHHNNLHAYIQRKIDEDPRAAVDYESESEPEEEEN